MNHNIGVGKVDINRPNLSGLRALQIGASMYYLQVPNYQLQVTESLVLLDP